MLQRLAKYDFETVDMSSFNGKRKHPDDYNHTEYQRGKKVKSIEHFFFIYYLHHAYIDIVFSVLLSIGYWNARNGAQYGSSESPPTHNVDNDSINGMDNSLFNSIPNSAKNGLPVAVSPQHLDSTTSSVYFTSDHLSGSDNEIDENRSKRKRNPVPDNKKDDKYWQRRQKNNIAAKRSREMKKRKVEDELQQAQEAVSENTQLKQEVEVLKAEISSLRRLLKDANMTLSLWIKARQVSEAPSKLPPMIRNHTNMPYVTFPVTSSNIP